MPPNGFIKGFRSDAYGRVSFLGDGRLRNSTGFKGQCAADSCGHGRHRRSAILRTYSITSYVQPRAYLTDLDAVAEPNTHPTVPCP